MSIGLGIFLFVVGAILTFALNVQTDWIDFIGGRPSQPNPAAGSGAIVSPPIAD